MEDRDLRKLRRADLLEVLVQQVQENNRLKKELADKDTLISEHKTKAEMVETTARAVSEIKEAIESENRIIQEIRRRQDRIGAFYFGASEEVRTGREDITEKTATALTPAPDKKAEEPGTYIEALP